MDNRNGFHPFSVALARGNLVYCMQNVGAVIAIAAPIADADDHIFENDKAVLALVIVWARD